MVNNKRYIETKAGRETHNRDFGYCFHTTSTCAFCVRLSIVSMYNFMKAYIRIENIQVRLAADSIQKRGICFHRTRQHLHTQKASRGVGRGGVINPTLLIIW